MAEADPLEPGHLGYSSSGAPLRLLRGTVFKGEFSTQRSETLDVVASFIP